MFDIVRSKMAVCKCGFLFFKQNCHQFLATFFEKSAQIPYQPPFLKKVLKFPISDLFDLLHGERFLGFRFAAFENDMSVWRITLLASQCLIDSGCSRYLNDCVFISGSIAVCLVICADLHMNLSEMLCAPNPGPMAAYQV
jgi:hypothetical protein